MLTCVQGSGSCGRISANSREETTEVCVVCDTGKRITGQIRAFAFFAVTWGISFGNFLISLKSSSSR